MFFNLKIITPLEQVIGIMIVALVVSIFFLIFSLILGKFRLKESKVSLIVKSPRIYLVLVLTLISSLLIIFLIKIENEPIKSISSTELNNSFRQEIANLQEKGLASSNNSGIYFLDIRDRKIFAKEHLKASASRPKEQAIKDVYPQTNPIVIIAGQDQLGDAVAVARSIKSKEGKASYLNYQKYGTIFIIKDGYQGLKKVGLKTESGTWD